jgi:hypothetical protein
MPLAPLRLTSGSSSTISMLAETVMARPSMVSVAAPRFASSELRTCALAHR